MSEPRRFSPVPFLIFGAIFLILGANQVIQVALTPDHIWWTPRHQMTSPAGSRDRVEIFVEGTPLAERFEKQEILLQEGEFTRPLNDIGIALRFNNYDRARAERTWRSVTGTFYLTLSGSFLIVALALWRGWIQCQGRPDPYTKTEAER